MFWKSILVVALLASATTQALAVNCDLRCAPMNKSTENISCGQHAPMTVEHEQMGHWNGMSMQVGVNSPPN
jgi:hypothetical protein